MANINTLQELVRQCVARNMQTWPTEQVRSCCGFALCNLICRCTALPGSVTTQGGMKQGHNVQRRHELIITRIVGSGAVKALANLVRLTEPRLLEACAAALAKIARFESTQEIFLLH